MREKSRYDTGHVNKMELEIVADNELRMNERYVAFPVECRVCGKAGVRPVYKYNPEKEYNRKHRLQYKCLDPDCIASGDPRPQDDRKGGGWTPKKDENGKQTNKWAGSIAYTTVINCHGVSKWVLAGYKDGCATRRECQQICDYHNAMRGESQ